MKKRIIIYIFLFLFFSIFTNMVLAKYVIEEKLEVAIIKIDRTAPKIKIKYSTKELTDENVEVIIEVNEEIQEVNGWSINENKKVIKKEYSENINEEIEIKDLSGNITKAIIEIDNIDKYIPTIEIQKVLNSNKLYPSYANKDAEILIDIEIKDDKKIEKSLEIDDIKIMVNNEEINPSIKELKVQEDTEKQKKIVLKISGIQEEGNLKIKMPKDIIKDEIGNSNIEIEKDLNIKIDNTNPEATYSQEKIEDGKIEAFIIANEGIRNLEGWTKDNDTNIKKVFTSNVSYITEIQDYAGNKTELEINVTDATNIVLKYASHNSEIGWTYGYGNYDIAGLKAIQENAKYKTESLAFSISGNVEKDFLQVRAYVHTHWGEGSASICHQNNQIYYHGWNPSETEWDTLMSKENIILEGENYIQFGGGGTNFGYNTDINGNNPIPEKVSMQYKYGISAIQLKLKDTNEYSIAYQVYVDGKGWIETSKNGEIQYYKEDNPISAIRIALIPNSELNSLINTWNKDVRKNCILTYKNH